MNITLKGLITSFSKSIDLYNFLLKNHHRRTAIAAYRIGKSLGLSEDCLSDLVIAAALHDIGALTINERDQLILKNIEGLEEIIGWAAGHHENHDGSGYPMNLEEKQITEEMDIISYADIYTALSEDRPYRGGLEKEEILTLLHNEFSDKHGDKILSVIEKNLGYIDAVCKEAVQEGIERFHTYKKMSEQENPNLSQG